MKRDPIEEKWKVDQLWTRLLDPYDIGKKYPDRDDNRLLKPIPQHKWNVNSIVHAASTGELDPSKIRDILGTNVNVYPVGTAGTCCGSAYFIALEGRMGHHIHAELAGQVGSGASPWSLARMLAELVQHMRRCHGTTTHAILITDSWDATEFEKWRPDLKTLRIKGVQIDVYLVGEGRMCTRMW